MILPLPARSDPDSDPEHAYGANTGWFWQQTQCIVVKWKLKAERGFAQNCVRVLAKLSVIKC